MNAAFDEFAEARTALKQQALDTAFLEALAGFFSRTSSDQHQELVGQFHNCAGRFPYVADSDFGALLLEVTADELADPVLRERLYTEALYRARWCAQGASSGGEGGARASHLERLRRKLEPEAQP